MNKITIPVKNSKKKTEMLDKIRNDELTVKFTMNMPVGLHQELKIYAARQRMNMVDIILPILSDHIQKNV